MNDAKYYQIKYIPIWDMEKKAEESYKYEIEIPVLAYTAADAITQVKINEFAGKILKIEPSLDAKRNSCSQRLNSFGYPTRR